MFVPILEWEDEVSIVLGFTKDDLISMLADIQQGGPAALSPAINLAKLAEGANTSGRPITEIHIAYGETETDIDSMINVVLGGVENVDTRDLGIFNPITNEMRQEDPS